VSNIFGKKYLLVANDRHCKSTNFQYKISCISGAAKRTNMKNFGNTFAHSKL
jgi:hypothetical protein